MKRAPCLLLLLALLPLPAHAQGDPAVPRAADPAPSPAAWINALRAASGVAPVEEDALLSATAARWAEALAAAGVLSHRGDDGSTSLERYRRLGGTEARVGEIIGAGPSLADIEAAWEASPGHRQAVLRPYWTHAGWGRAPAGGGWVSVVLFCQKLVTGLRIRVQESGLEISGWLVPAEVREPVLLAGLARVAPALWDPVTRGFLFRLAASESSGYIRLGYAGAAGELVVTNAFTLPRGKESREATGRFEAPAAPP